MIEVSGTLNHLACIPNNNVSIKSQLFDKKARLLEVQKFELSVKLTKQNDKGLKKKTSAPTIYTLKPSCIFHL